ncbi:hypothetical protein VTK56DRAFT_2441 [Thermocarpiscus australiensis]
MFIYWWSLGPDHLAEHGTTVSSLCHPRLSSFFPAPSLSSTAASFITSPRLPGGTNARIVGCLAESSLCLHSVYLSCRFSCLREKQEGLRIAGGDPPRCWIFVATSPPTIEESMVTMSPVGTGPVLAAAITPIGGSPSLAPAANANADVPAFPPGFPAQLTSDLAWTGSDFAETTDHILVLNDTELAEIRAAVESYKALDQDGDLVEPANFPLPTLGVKLKERSRDVHGGRGFCVIRGIDPTSYSVEDLTLAYLGVQSYIAEQRGRQDKRGNMLVHIVADNSTKQAAEHHRHSTKSITFHNEEAGDVISWLTRSTAAAGGKCIIASAHTVYNVLAATRPEVIRTLARSDWPFALPRFKCRPVIFYQDSKLIMNFGRAALLGSDAHPRPEHLPSLTRRQMEALDAIEAIAQATQLEIETQAGDMHFINNLAILHRREGFVNGESPAEKRHLVRMRLRSAEQGWPIPPELEREWHDAFGMQGDRHWHLEPMPLFFFPLRRQPN